MPYEEERAGYRSVHRIAQSPRVKGLLSRARIRDSGAPVNGDDPLRGIDLEPTGWLPDLVLAIDGSYNVVDVRNGYPGANLAYVTVAAVLLDVQRMRKLDERRPVDPALFRSTRHIASIDEALPGVNVVVDTEETAKASLRRVLFESLKDVRVADDAESLLDTYEALLDAKPPGHRQKCPYDAEESSCGSASKEYKRGKGQYACGCSFNKAHFSSDALRFHEGMQPQGDNGAMYAEVIQVLERLWVIHLLRWLERKQWLTTLDRLAIVVDGPLAIFGHPAWLAPAFSAEIIRLNEETKHVTQGRDLLLLGIEKTGLFVQHVAELDETPGGGSGKLAPGWLKLLDDAYIRKHVVAREGGKPYGQDTYFGRKFLYKTRSGALIVGTSPFVKEADWDTKSADLEQYPRIGDVISLLDTIASSRFEHSLMPIVEAHAEAAIPLRLGTKVLEELAKRLMPK